MKPKTLKAEDLNFLKKLSEVIAERAREASGDEPSDSYTVSLFRRGINKVAQKVGEEAVELVIESKDQDEKLFLNEAADLLYHYLVLLEAKGHNLGDVVKVLESRHR